MEKHQIKEILLNMKTAENEEVVNSLLKSLDEVSDEIFNQKLEQANVTENNIEQFLANLIARQNTPEENHNFIPVNEWFSYGRTNNTIHLHIIPKDLRGVKNELGDEAFYNHFKDLLEDFLSRMQGIFLEDPTIKNLFAVSPVFYNQNISWAFESLGFDKLIEIDMNNENDNMSKEQKEYFINMFNKGIKTKKVYYTKMTREKFLGMEYSQIDDKTHTM